MTTKQKRRIATVPLISEIVTEARERLRAAIDRACIARGEAQWLNGYHRGSGDALGGVKDERQFHKSRVESAMRAYARAIRDAR
jgi:hypothetical protein